MDDDDDATPHLVNLPYTESGFHLEERTVAPPRLTQSLWLV